jgi:putative ABC transport system permease protein
VRGILLRPLPYRDVDCLMIAGLSVPDYEDVRAANRVFDRMAVFASNKYLLSTAGETDQVLGGVVSADFFPMLSAPALGRAFAPEEVREPLVVLSDSLWRTRFGADRSVLGRSIQLSGKPYTIVGVMPPEFEFPTSRFQLWVPFELSLAGVPQQARNRSLRIFRAIGHVKAGVPAARAREEVRAISARLQKEYPETNSGVEILFQPLPEALVGNVRGALLVLLATAGLVLLIVCANLANLTLARMTSRSREIAVRSALGASRWRVARHVMAESVTLSLVGGAAGVVGAAWAMPALFRFAPPGMPRLTSVHVDGAVLLFSLAISLATALFFGPAPFFGFSRISLFGRLKEGGRGGTGTARARRLRGGLVVAEVAVSVVVLAGAGLLLRSFDRLLHVETGFESSRLLTFNMELVRFEPPEKRAEVLRAAMERLSRLPGVVVSGAGTGLPAETPQRGTGFAVAGVEIANPDDGRAYFMAITPDYFRALKTRLVEGRFFTDADRAGAAPVVLVSRGLARLVCPSATCVGRSLRLVNPEQSNEWRTIVGVVDDVRYSGLDDAVRSAVYTPFSQTPFPWAYGMLRTSAPPETLAKAVRTAVAEVEPGLAAASVRPMEQIVSSAVAQPRFQAFLLSSFGALALLLAAVGIYGVMSYGVTQRREEIGIRMALGARSGQVLGLIAGQGIRLVALGLGLGLAGALAATRLLRGQLFEIGTTDPLTFAAIFAVLAGVGLVASYLPALRALKVDPMTALRSE